MAAIWVLGVWACASGCCLVPAPSSMQGGLADKHNPIIPGRQAGRLQRALCVAARLLAMKSKTKADAAQAVCGVLLPSGLHACRFPLAGGACLVFGICTAG